MKPKVEESIEPLEPFKPSRTGTYQSAITDNVVTFTHNRLYMQVSASVRNSFRNNNIIVSTNGTEKTIVVESKADGYGSSINGGEFLFLSIATCFCNDVYREAVKRKMKVELVEVIVNGEFGQEGEPGFNLTYSAKVEAPGHAAEEINDLIGYVDRIAEIHNTLRKGVEVELV